MSSTTSTTTTSKSRADATINLTRVSDEPRTLQQQSSDEDSEGEGFLTHNGSPTGLEPVNNPPTWPTDHRRVPPYRAPVVNPAWSRIAGDTAAIRTFMWTMLSGCQLLQWGYMVPRGLGLHARGYGMYQIANEW
ncbi:hypothetical protein ASPSYDRAFT_529645 [Aspergillus sydowii CBS 593.65]|uniref:Uncharacterized protein n=1 Tax=Aspergillus sydowii CBS 593.65 TaxID=1036612 RepID=A0A1L9T1V3_9EURO|nr:uncharacterized protein ASPSYDRAFT_529645 [Aspergillus sydowii CBS 593.65]OJJ53416.1 hypothetical protein ASPSYDRAFT_529645 [Aspergillus sydowii CBS 593.65]